MLKKYKSPLPEIMHINQHLPQYAAMLLNKNYVRLGHVANQDLLEDGNYK